MSERSEQRRTVKAYRAAYDACITHEQTLGWLLDNTESRQLDDKFKEWADKKEELRKELAKAFWECSSLLYGSNNNLSTCIQVISPTQWVKERLEDAEAFVKKNQR